MRRRMLPAPLLPPDAKSGIKRDSHRQYQPTQQIAGQHIAWPVYPPQHPRKANKNDEVAADDLHNQQPGPPGRVRAAKQQTKVEQKAIEGNHMGDMTRWKAVQPQMRHHLNLDIIWAWPRHPAI